MKIENKQSSFLTIFYVAISCIFIGGFIGAITNMVNGAFYPTYYKIVMGWDFEALWLAIVAQGIFEGVIYGIIFSLIYTTGYGIITKGKANYKFALKHLLKLTLMVLACWTIGGILSLLLASISPEFYKANHYKVPNNNTEILKYAWVGGSIWGAMIGGLLSTILGIVIIKNSWRSFPE